MSSPEVLSDSAKSQNEWSTSPVF